VDIGDLKEILRILEEQDITEFELEQDGTKLRVCRASQAGTTPAPAGASLISATPAPPPSQAPAPLAGPGGVAGGTVAGPGESAGAAPAAPAGTVVKSPIVGTFYRSPDPNSRAFVNVGDHIKVGQVLCIIEAMKLMNEIEAELAGEVLAIHVENGQAIQYGDPLFTVRPA
jgi:acetyl-CoA carboxylase biotin carboxyl carrier protein